MRFIMMRVFVSLLLFLVQSNADDAFVSFELDLLQKLASRSNQDNVVVSGFSVLNALALAYAGAEGQVLAEFEQKLGQSPVDGAFHSRLLTLFDTNNDNFTLYLANRAYIDEKVKTIKSSYVNKLNNVYYSGIQRVNFSQPVKTANVINHFVRKVTQGLIKKVVGANSFEEKTRLVLVNALYFKAEFSDPFLPSHTTNKTFRVKESVEQTVPTMIRTGQLPYTEDDNVQVVALEYNGDARLVLILPKRRFGLNEVLQNLTYDKLGEYINVNQTTDVELHLPRFNVSFESQLKNPLIHLGFPRGIGGTNSFTAIAENERYSVDQVVHKAVFKTYEQGSTGAASTAVVMTARSSFADDYTDFHADHPFLFLVVARGIVVFSGVVRQIE